MTQTAKDLIDSSITHDNISSARHTEELAEALQAVCDDSVEGNDVVEYWACDDAGDGMDWRVHLLRPEHHGYESL